MAEQADGLSEKRSAIRRLRKVPAIVCMPDLVMGFGVIARDKDRHCGRHIGREAAHGFQRLPPAVIDSGIRINGVVELVLRQNFPALAFAPVFDWRLLF